MYFKLFLIELDKRKFSNCCIIKYTLQWTPLAAGE